MGAITSIEIHYRNVDGWHVFTSDDIAGLYVASKDPKQAFNDVAPSIEKLIELNEGLTCTVTLESTVSDFIRRIKGVSAGRKAKSTSKPITLTNHRYAISCPA